MSLAYVLDEHLRGPLWRAIESHNRRSAELIDAVRVGEVEDLPLGTADEELLVWTERENRILVTLDRRTMPIHLAHHLEAGGHCPGIFALRRGAQISRVVSFLVLAAYASEPDEWADRIEYVHV